MVNYLFIFQMMYKSQLQKKKTLMTGFVVQGHIYNVARIKIEQWNIKSVSLR